MGCTGRASLHRECESPFRTSMRRSYVHRDCGAQFVGLA
jgi:hypothetical protein